MAATDSPSKIYFQVGSQRGKTRRVQSSSVTRRPFASLSEASRTPPGAPAPAPPGGCPSSQRPSRRCPRCSGRRPRRTSTSPLPFVQNREASVPQSSSGPLGPDPAAVGPVSTGMPPPQPVPAVRAPASASAPGSCRPESPDSPVQAPQRASSAHPRTPILKELCLQLDPHRHLPQFRPGPHQLASRPVLPFGPCWPHYRKLPPPSLQLRRRYFSRCGWLVP